MSYTFRYKGIDVVCDTIEELREAACGLADEDAPASLPTAAPANNSPSKPRPSPRPSHPSTRNVADATYLKYAWRIVRSLLAVTSEVGKLRSTLAKEFDLGKATIEATLRRLTQEQPPFLYVHQEARGISPYVRLTDRAAAENFTTTQERLYKERLEAELKT